MAGFLATLATGTWITRERMLFVPWALLAAFTVGFGYLIVTADGVVDVLGRPLGTDFSNIYVAGTHVLAGRPAAPFDPALQFGQAQLLFGPNTPFYGWPYPPVFLFVAAALALMPYGLALAVWQVVTLLLYVWAMRTIIGGASGPVEMSTIAGKPIAPTWLLLAVTFPAVFINLGHGHNGFLTAALMGGALVLLDRRPIVAGLLFGLLAYKPQFGLMIPVVLIATGRWRTFAAAAATVMLLALATTVAFGPQVWDAFLASTRFTRIVGLEQGDIGWHKIQSVFSWVRMWGGSVGLAYAIQGAVTLTVAAALVRLWRSEAPFALKAAGLPIAAILATPYSLDYDMMVLAPAIAFLVVEGLAHGFPRWQKTALVALWLMPLFARSITQWTMLPLGVLVLLAMFALILSHAPGRRVPRTVAAVS